MPDNQHVADFEPFTLGKLIEETDEAIGSGDMDESIVESGDGDGTEFMIQVAVANHLGEMRLHTVVGVEPREDGAAFVLNINPVGRNV